MATRIVRKYHIEAMSNGYSLKILDEALPASLEATEVFDSGETVAHFVVGGLKANTKPETLRRKIVGYAVAELREQLEKAIDEADSGRPELPDMPPPPPADPA